MAQEERYGQRCMAYSAWHRQRSTGRYIGIENAQRLAQIDLDHVLWVEYDDETKEPIALVEAARDVGQNYKNATVTQNLAKRADLPAFVVLYLLGDEPNPAETKYMDIVGFRVKRLYPQSEREWTEMTPQEWAERLLAMRSWQAARFDKEMGYEPALP